MQEDRERKRRARPKVVARTRRGISARDAFGIVTTAIAVWVSVLVCAAGLQRMDTLQNEAEVMAMVTGQTPTPALVAPQRAAVGIGAFAPTVQR